MPRNADGTMSGAQCLTGAIDLYSYVGALRLQLLAIIAAENERQAPPR